MFAKMASRIRAALPDADVRHIGSTAVPGSLTKGDLDVLVRVSQNDFQAADRVLGAMFDRNTGSVRTDSFSAFMDSSTSPELGVQLVATGTAFDTFVEWVDRLASDRKLRDAYDELKARYQGKDMEDYRRAKKEFISENLRR